MTDSILLNQYPVDTRKALDRQPALNRKLSRFLLRPAVCGAISLGFLAASAQEPTVQSLAVQTPAAPGLAVQSLAAQTQYPARSFFQPVADLPLAASVASLSSNSAALPDDPSAGLGSADTTGLEANAAADNDSPTPQTRHAERAASIHMKYIPAGWSTRQPLPARDKVLLGFRDLYSPLTLSGIVLSAGYSHLTDGQPNYGVNSAAFGKRLGAAVLRDSTEGIFTDTVFAPLLHEDPRYYVEGPQYGFFHRTVYSITRPLVTRTDSGHTSVNGALLLGYASASALSYTYYPQINQNFRDTAATFGGAIGGAALGFFVSEFSADVLHKLHLGKLL